MAVDVDGGNVLQLVKSGVTELGRRLEWNPVRQDQIISWLENDADHVLIQLDHRLYTSVYRLEYQLQSNAAGASPPRGFGIGMLTKGPARYTTQRAIIVLSSNFKPMPLRMTE